MLTLFSVSMFAAEPVTVKSTFTKATKPENNKVTDLAEVVTWDIATTIGAGEPAIAGGTSNTVECLKFGNSKSIYFSKVEFSTDYYKDYKVTSVKFGVVNNGKKTGTFTAKQGETTIGSESKEFGNTAWEELTATGAKGEGGTLTVTYEVAQAFYLSYIEVTYEEAGGDDPQPTTRTLYCKVVQSWWKADGAAVGIYAFKGEEHNAAWPGERMTLAENETEVWTATIDAKYEKVIFVRVNASGDIAYWGAKTADMVVPADKDLYTITSTTEVWGDPGVTGTWSVYGEEQGEEEPATIKLHGNFNGSDWANTDAFSLADDKKTASLKLTLNKGNYEFGVRVGADNDWTANGVAFTRENKSAEVVKGSGNLTLAADTKGDYTFTWTYATNTLAIDFPEYVESLPVMEIAGAWDVKDEAWVKNAMTAAEDKKTASYEVELKAGDYEFKVIKDSKWLTKANGGNAYGLHREWTGVANVKDEATENLKLTADVDGKYTFVWTFANDSLGVVFPAKPVELQAVSEAITWDFSKITANTANALYNKEGIQLTDESTPNKNEEVVYANYSADFMTFAEGFDATTMAFKGEYPIRKNQYCQAGTLHFKTTVAGKIVVKFSDTGSSASATAVKRYLVVNGEQTEYWTSRENNGEAPYAAQLNVVSDEIAVPAGDVTITGSSAIVMYYVTFTPAAEPVVEPTLADGFYLIGKIGGVEGWNVADLKAEQKFAPNLENPVEFMLDVTLAEGDELKVVNVLNNEITAWFPGGESSNFNVTAAYAGEKTVYFRPDQQGGEGWHYGCIYIAPNQGTGISNTAVEGKAVKMIMDGQLLIIRNGKTYNVQGQQLK